MQIRELVLLGVEAETPSIVVEACQEFVQDVLHVCLNGCDLKYSANQSLTVQPRVLNTGQKQCIVYFKVIR